MTDLVTVIKSKETFTPFWFYTEFLNDLAKSYLSGSDLDGFKLFEHGDDRVYDSDYRIDPIAIPLILSVFGQLKTHYGKPVNLYLYNNSATKHALAFLDRANFFKISGNNRNPNFPLGRNIANFNEKYLGFYESEAQRAEHQVRAYSLQEDDLEEELSTIVGLEAQRDHLSSHYTYKVKSHFAKLLSLNSNTWELRHLFIDIMSELITNGVLHSKSVTYSLMFVDRFSTKFSISDNGIGLAESMDSKKETYFYKPKELTGLLNLDYQKVNVNKSIRPNIYVLFETLYYSSLKNRQGLFDLMINVVLNSKGYFRLHTDHCQIVVSNRMMSQLQRLQQTRRTIAKKYNEFDLGQILREDLEKSILKEAQTMKYQFVDFFNFCLRKYSQDVIYSSVRFYNVKFRGVHIEVEIPFEKL